MESNEPNIIFHPMISSIQKIALYETKSRFYLMGSNNNLTRFRVLKIDRMEPRELVVVDDKMEYTHDEIADLVTMIDIGNRSSNSNSNSKLIGQRNKASGVARIVSAFGIVGFVRFLEGYYIILVTKRRRVAVIGHHTIYKIEDTSMIYIPNDTVRVFHPDEQRYVRMFQSIDLSSNFYFSYSYDLTHTLQNNLAPPKHIFNNNNNNNNNLNGDGNQHKKTENPDNKNTDEDDDKFINMWTQSTFKNNDRKIIDYGVRSNPNRRFVWNNYLLSAVERDLHRDWILYVTHGFIGQSNVCIFGKSIYITLIARRSNKYAGTRFLKRGANSSGDVANEVETEQIVYDSAVSSLYSGRFTSFVQMRGSVPGNWSQDISKMVPKPTISCDLADPFYEIAGAHFNKLLKRYGTPTIILSLVKKREKKKHESTLSDELTSAVRYLNQFLSPENQLQYVSFDMARMNKGKEAKVMSRLANIANNAVIKTGIFQSQVPYYSQKKLFIDNSLPLTRKSHCHDDNNEDQPVYDKITESFIKRGTLQTGIIRTNCVDCLDRTNTAQFAIGKCALGYQLCALGVLDSAKLEFDSDCVRMLEELYEDHGDTLALQYGGSQLVHRIKTYRKTAPWTSQGNDIMQTLSRYYSNTFSDQEKQHTINLFLGLFTPEEGRAPLWELLTDYYLHHTPVLRRSDDRRGAKSLTQWWDNNTIRCLPYAYDDIEKTCWEMVQVDNTQEEMIDVYSDYHRPYELVPLSEMYAYQISHSIRDFMPHFTTNFSPFAVRVRPGRRREETGNKRNGNIKNPSMTGQSSTSSTASSASSSVDTSSDDEDDDLVVVRHQRSDLSARDANDVSVSSVSFEALFPTMKEVYGVELENPRRSDLVLYKRFVMIGRNAAGFKDHSTSIQKSKMVQQATFPDVVNFSKKQVDYFKLPKVDDTSVSIYEQYVQRGKNGGFIPNPTDMILYEKYTYESKLCLGI
ncbi:polyphosphoinositide phosphatase isoform X2 [Microplitis mediator]|uniref:polyphosphoinositide phosphatase isoform X2 n=1 Tax=Microplitis mediator TaxID=375433 RepID=UPI0025548642|nr:polyphosphoinositide phosphatase isoform X2 [Microplitis mediator]